MVELFVEYSGEGRVIVHGAKIHISIRISDQPCCLNSASGLQEATFTVIH